MRAELLIPGFQPPHLVVAVAGAKGGVGASSVASLLAAAAAATGQRTLLVEASAGGGPLDLLLGLDTAPAGASDLSTTVVSRLELARIPMHVVRPAERRLRLRRMLGAGTDAERVVIDAGSRVDEVLEASNEAARLLVVTRRDRVSLAAAYAVLKSIWYALPELEAALVLNGCTPEEGDIAGEIVRSASLQFLGRPVRTLAVLPDDADYAARVEAGEGLERLCGTPLGGAVQQAALAAFASPEQPHRTPLRIRNG